MNARTVVVERKADILDRFPRRWESAESTWVPRISWAAYLNRTGGLSCGKIVSALKEIASLGGQTRDAAVARLAQAAEPSYEKLIENLRESKVIYPDERVRAQEPAFLLRVYATAGQTVYWITLGRGYQEVSRVLGEGYSGLIGSDGWAPYGRLFHVRRQTCLSHLLRRCREMQEVATGSAVQFPSEVKILLQAALAVRDRWDARHGQTSPHGVRIAQGHLQGRMALVGQRADRLSPSAIGRAPEAP